jgi:hypothetical protein
MWKQKYGGHKTTAKQPGIPFQLTFGQWFGIWAASGHMHERGTQRGQYVMARRGDKGAYESGNVNIITAKQNRKDAKKIGRPVEIATVNFVGVKLPTALLEAIDLCVT